MPIDLLSKLSSSNKIRLVHYFVNKKVLAPTESAHLYITFYLFLNFNLLSTMAFESALTMTPMPIVLGPISLSPWANFAKVWTAVMGYPAEDFEFVVGETPFSTLKETVAIIVVYLVVIFGGRELMRERQPMKLNALFKVHNFVLSVLSATLLVLFAEQLIPSIWKGGLYENICGASGWTHPLVVLYYVSFDSRV